MFIRRYHNKRQDGSKGYGHILLEGHRIRGKVKQRTLFNLGRNFSVPKEHWTEVTCEVEYHLRGTLPADGDPFPFKDIAKRLKEGDTRSIGSPLITSPSRPNSSTMCDRSGVNSCVRICLTIWVSPKCYRG